MNLPLQFFGKEFSDKSVTNFQNMFTIVLQAETILGLVGLFGLVGETSQDLPAFFVKIHRVQHYKVRDQVELLFVEVVLALQKKHCKRLVDFKLLNLFLCMRN
jgi:hypothetical protein